MTREQAMEALRTIGVPLADSHGTVEALHTEIRSKQRPRRERVSNIHSQCLNKRRHASHKAAQDAIRRQGVRAFGVREYRCPHCGWFHTGRPGR